MSAIERSRHAHTHHDEMHRPKILLEQLNRPCSRLSHLCKETYSINAMLVQYAIINSAILQMPVDSTNAIAMVTKDPDLPSLLSSLTSAIAVKS